MTFNKTKKKAKNKKINIWDEYDSVFDKDTVSCVYDKSSDLCDLCNEVIKVSESNVYICSNQKCGKIVERLDHSPEWRYYSGESGSDPSRCGMPINPLLKESSYACRVGYGSSYEMRKIRKYTEWQSMPYKEKSLYDEFEKIKTLASDGGIPKIIIDTALGLHKQIIGEKTFRGVNRHGIIAASVYISCRINNFPRTARELAEIFKLDSTSATKGCKNAISILNKLDNTSEHSITQPSDFIERYSSKLNINEDITKLCTFVSMKVISLNIIPENTPHAVAAGIIYLVSNLCNLNISKGDIMEKSGISEVTINKCYKKMAEHQDKIIPPMIIARFKK
jgi:transcription initiation factor TFIIB